MQYVSVDVTVETEQFIRASDGLAMQRQLDVALGPASDEDSGITSAELACGGDGHSFILRIGRVEAEPTGSLSAVKMAVYVASDDRELPKARAAAVVRLNEPLAVIRDELFAGGQKGHPFMGIIVTGTPVG
jgi:hypothetical protein